MAIKITQKYELFKDVDGDPLENGYIYIGTIGLNPEVSPITVYFDEALTLPATQPLRTSGGYIQNAGTPANIYVDTDYSITVRNKNETLIYTSLSNNVEAGLSSSVDVIGDLIGLDEATTTEELEVYGYHAKGDGAGDLFIWDATVSKPDANGGTIIDPSVSLANQGTGVGTGCWIRQYSEVINVKWFGAKGDDSTDDVLAIQSAIDSISGGGIVFAPSGIYRTSLPLVLAESYTSLIGEGEYATEIKSTSVSGNIIEIGDGSNITNTWIEKLAISSNIAKTSGAGILLQNHHFCGVDRVRQDNNLYDGIRIEGGATHFGTYIRNCELNGGSNTAIRIGATATAVDTYLSNLIIGGESTARGIEIQRASGIYAVNIDIISRDIGIKIMPDTGESVRYLFCTNVLADTSDQEGWQFIGLGEISQINLTNCWAATNGHGTSKSGIIFNNANTDGVTLNGMSIINNGGHGIEILKGTNISILAGCQIYFNNTDIGSRHGIVIGVDVSGWTISGNRIGQGGAFSGNNQVYGIFINGGTTDEYIITDNDLTGNVTGALNSISYGADIDVRGNKGYVTYNRGAVTVLQAIGSIVVTHNMGTIPSARNIRITPMSDTLGVRWWVTSIDATTFTIIFNTTASTDVDFSWEVDITRN